MRPKKLYWRSTYGIITVNEPLFRQGTRLYRPFSVSAGVQCRSVSQPLQRVITDLGADHPFRQISGKLQEHYGIAIPHETARRITESHGRQVLDSQILEATWPSEPGEDCILVEMDGGMVPVVQSDPASPDQRKKKTLEWKELKLCVARSLSSARPVYGGTFSGGVEGAGQQLYHCARQAGLGNQTEVHGVGDGAPWIAGQVEQHFGKQGAYLIDFYHLSEYLGEAAKVCSSEPASWLKQQQTDLKANRPAKVLESLWPYLENGSVPDEKAPVRKARRYLKNRLSQVNYRDAIEKERPIGSGEIESAHRFVVQERLKKAGGWWAPHNIDPMLALRLIRINGQWEAYWDEKTRAEAA